MGPRPDGRGRPNRSSHTAPTPMRQWGRDRMAAEGGGRINTVYGKYGRQWGRDRMAAEGGAREGPV